MSAASGASTSGARPALRVRVLGTSAGGGLPQWNCACENCRAARVGDLPARTQSSIAVSADGERWLLVNASPDVRAQVQWLAPATGRGSGIAAVAVTSADIDHSAGLLVLREGGVPPVYATAPVRRALESGLHILPALAAFGRVDARPLVAGETTSFADREGVPLGVLGAVVGLSGRPPPYMRARGEPSDPSGEDVVALALHAEGSARTLLYAPGVAAFDAELARQAASAEAILFDGTCYAEDEVAPLLGKTARDMGHVVVSGPGGSLEFLSRFPQARRLYVHVNNTNPILRPNGPERAAGVARGIGVADDGLELEI